MAFRDLVPTFRTRNNDNNSPFLPIETLRDEMDQLFENFFPTTARPLNWTGRGVMNVGQADICETDNEIQVMVDLPGMKIGDLDVTFSEGHLNIRGKREDVMEEEGRNYHRVERAHGAFQRSFLLPCEVEEDKVDAKFKDGVLKITMPKTERARKAQRRIKIKES